MPYASNEDLPSEVKDNLPAAAQSVFRRVVNSTLKAGAKEVSAFRQAWGAVKRGFKQQDGKWIAKAEPKTLYVRRDVLNADEIIAWAKGQGFKTTLPADEMHVTVMFTRSLVDWMKVPDSWAGDEDGNVDVKPGGARVVEGVLDPGQHVVQQPEGQGGHDGEDVQGRHGVVSRVTMDIRQAA